MKTSNLLEFEIRRKLIEALIKQSENEKDSLRESIFDIRDSSDDNHQTLPQPEIDRRTKPLADKYIELEKGVLLFRRELSRLNRDPRKRQLQAASTAVAREAKNIVVKDFVSEYQRKNTDSNLEDAFNDVAETLAMNYDAVKRAFYYKPKKSHK